MKNYIEWDNTNSQWHEGYINVYINNKCIQHFNIEDLEATLEEFNIDFYIFDFIDELKEKYGIENYIQKK